MNDDWSNSSNKTMATSFLILILLMGLSMASSSLVLPPWKHKDEDESMVETYQGNRHLQQVQEDGFDGGVCYNIFPFDPLRHKALYKVGVLTIRGKETAFAEFNKTFNEYLTLTAGQRFDPPIQFEMVPISFNEMFEHADIEDFDFFFVNPSAYSCIESEHSAASLGTIVARRTVNDNVYDLKQFGGVMFTKSDRDDISTIQNFTDKIVAAASISGLGSGQMQFKRLIDAGMNHLQDPLQVVFTSDQDKIVQGVAAGLFDVGFIRTDQLERSKDPDGVPYNLDDFKFIEPLEGLLTVSGDPFPFQSSTELYPEWNLAALSHVDVQVQREVQRAIMSVGDHAKVGDDILRCYETDSPAACYVKVFTEFHDGDIRCDTTRDIAIVASEACETGKYSNWDPSLSYLQLRSMQEASGFISVKPNTTTWQCIRSEEIYDAISCPAGTYRKSKEEVEQGCSSQGLDCGEGFQCICRPCAVPEVEETCENAASIGGKCVPVSVLIPSIVLPILILVAVVVCFYVQYKKKQNDSVWMVKPQELIFADPPEVIGRGTFGEVHLAEYRGTSVAVKRVIPVYSRKIGKIGSVGSKSSTSDIETGRVISKLDTASNLTTFSSAGSKKLKISDQKSSGSRGSNQSNGDASLQVIKLKAGNYMLAKSEFIEEMRHLSKLRHPCITTVMGAVVGYNMEPKLVMEYMEYGSLYDLLHNDTVDLDGNMLLNMLQDISQGVRFLHCCDPQVIHGDLKAQNILVDDRFRAKVADFGFSHGRAKRQSGGTGTLFWMAPELLRGEKQNTAQTDVYSFGIIIYEVYSRKIPYEDEDPKEVLRLVADAAVRKRPPIPANCPAPIKSVMKDCLVHDPETRPTMDEIGTRFKRIEKKDVIRSVAGRQNVRSFDSFPEHVARQLKEGKKVESEHKECVSIVVIEMYRTPETSQSFDPRLVADATSRLNESLDSLAQNHGIFRLETVGERFMAVANLFDHQVDHVQRVAAFSLDALKVAGETLLDPLNPDVGAIQVKVGFHSGAVTADVVGRQNPRYCLFGDTVSTAVSLAAQGNTNCVICSFTSADALRKRDPNTRKQLRSRGMMTIKGKGKIHAYLLIEAWQPGGGSRPMSFVSGYDNSVTTTSHSTTSSISDDDEKDNSVRCDSGPAAESEHMSTLNEEDSLSRPSIGL